MHVLHDVRIRCQVNGRLPHLFGNYGEVSITIHVEGEAFNSGVVPDPTAPEYHLFTHGRGIYVMETLMD
jgi:hypothetical protein